jgi:hypothetical protein
MATSRPSGAAIKAAIEKSGLNLAPQDIAQLEQGRQVLLAASSLKSTTVQGGCSGLKIIDLGNRCGLYINLFPPTVYVCCET